MIIMKPLRHRPFARTRDVMYDNFNIDCPGFLMPCSRLNGGNPTLGLHSLNIRWTCAR